jgi:hypothetical protein
MSIHAVFSPPPALVAVMDAQHGVFTTGQGRSAGYTTDELQRLRSRRALLSVRRGVYADAARYRQLEPIERHRVDTQAALLRLASAAALSHETAAVWTGLAMLQPSLGVIHVTRPELPASHVHAGIHHHPGALPDDHVTVAGKARTTSPARTAVDIARSADFARGLAVADSCLHAGVSRAVLEDAMAFCASWPGARGASRAVSWADGRADNPGESYSRAVLIEQGLPPSDIQFAVHDEHGLVGLADFVWIDQWTLGEFDGRIKYAPGANADVEAAARVLWLEKQREDRLRAAGFEVVRWTWQDLQRPAELTARILAAFGRAAARRRTAN